ncbi:DUF389 domain-containing protein [Acrocarpospora corrugata]|nr:DUF389 domain-containing protein [Acrocarpospora corrugata]
MVLGPEFGAIAAICFGLLRRRPALIGKAIRALAIGFGTAIAITFACALVSSRLGWIDTSMLTGHQEVEFIVKPDNWSFIVALLAGAAGVLSIAAGKSSALVGVFISVTTPCRRLRLPRAGPGRLGRRRRLRSPTSRQHRRHGPGRHADAAPPTPALVPVWPLGPHPSPAARPSTIDLRRLESRARAGWT